MSKNFLNVGKNTYELIDLTIITPHDFVRLLYKFTNKGMLPPGSSKRFVDDYQVREAVIAADSSSKAITIFEDAMPLSRGGQLVKVELIGCDNRDRETNPVLSYSLAHYTPE